MVLQWFATLETALLSPVTGWPLNRVQAKIWLCFTKINYKLNARFA